MATGRTTEPRSVTVTKTSGSAALTAAAGTFAKGDAGRPVSGTGIPAGATLLSVTSDTAATLSANATASGSGALAVGVALSTDPAASGYGFRGWSPETDAEAATYTVAAAIAGTATPDRITNTSTGVTQRSRT